jgi:hypothetical protein
MDMGLEKSPFGGTALFPLLKFPTWRDTFMLLLLVQVRNFVESAWNGSFE